MAAIGNLVADIRLRTAKFTQGVNKVQGRMKRLEKSANGVTRAWGKFAGVAGIAGIGALTKSTLAHADALGKYADKIGISTTALQELQYAASQTGVSSNKLEMGLQRMTRRISEAARGSGEAKDAIKELGLSAQELANMAPDQAFRKIADAMQGVESQSERVRLAFKLFDSEGVALVNTLANGSAGLDTFAAKAHDLGIVIDESMVRQAETANDQLDTMSRIIKTKLSVALLNVLPEIVAVGNAFAGAFERATEFWDAMRRDPKTEAGLAKRILEIDKRLRARGRNKPNAAVAASLGLDRDSLQRQLDDLVRVRHGIDKEGRRIRAVIDRSVETRGSKATAGVDSSAVKKAEREVARSVPKMNVALWQYKANTLDLVAMSQQATDTVKESVDQVGEFVLEAARNMENAMATGFFDLIQGRATDLRSTFKNMLDRMVADALAARLGAAMFGNYDSTGKVGGWVGKAVGWLGGIFGGARANGGSVSAGSSYLVGERGPELFVPNGSGTIVPNGGGGVVVNMTVNTPDAGSFRKSQAQIVADTSRALQLAAR